MVSQANERQLVELPVDTPVWDRFFSVAPLVLIGTRDEHGTIDLAPKHMVTPLGWQNYFAFVCSPTHSTCRNIRRSSVFTVSYPKPDQLLYASLAASPRQETGEKPVLDYFATFPATEIEADFIDEAYLYFECRLFREIGGFGENCLLTGEIIAARSDPDYLRSNEIDDQERVHESPLFAYLAPGRFAKISESAAFPFPAHMKK